MSEIQANQVQCQQISKKVGVHHKIDFNKENEIILKIAEGYLQKDIADQYNVDKAIITRIKQKHESKITELQLKKSEETFKYIKIKAIEKAKELIESITKAKINRSQLGSTVLAVKELTALAYPQNNKNSIQISMDFGSILNKVNNAENRQNPPKIIDIKARDTDNTQKNETDKPESEESKEND